MAWLPPSGVLHFSHRFRKVFPGSRYSRSWYRMRLPIFRHPSSGLCVFPGNPIHSATDRQRAFEGHHSLMRVQSGSRCRTLMDWSLLFLIHQRAVYVRRHPPSMSSASDYKHLQGRYHVPPAYVHPYP